MAQGRGGLQPGQPSRPDVSAQKMSLRGVQTVRAGGSPALQTPWPTRLAQGVHACAKIRAPERDAACPCSMREGRAIFHG